MCWLSISATLTHYPFTTWCTQSLRMQPSTHCQYFHTKQAVFCISRMHFTSFLVIYGPGWWLNRNDSICYLRLSVIQPSETCIKNLNYHFATVYQTAQFRRGPKQQETSLLQVKSYSSRRQTPVLIQLYYTFQDRKIAPSNVGGNLSPGLDIFQRKTFCTPACADAQQMCWFRNSSANFDYCSCLRRNCWQHHYCVRNSRSRWRIGSDSTMES